MNIRAITLGIDPVSDDMTSLRSAISEFFGSADAAFVDTGLAVRTHRVSLSPFGSNGAGSHMRVAEIADQVSRLCEGSGVRWFCLPVFTAGAADYRALHDALVETIVHNKNAFLNVIAVHNDEMDLRGIHMAGRLIKSVSRLSNNGHDNFRLGISCNCRAHTPFFPFTYHTGKIGFSLALEFARDFLDIIESRGGDGLDAIHERLVEFLVERLAGLESTALEVERKTGMTYYGIDISLAPFPEDNHSVASIIERLGMESFGGNGTLFFTSYLTDILDEVLIRSGIRSTGFCGVMFSVLEDVGLGVHNNSKTFSMDSLLSYCSVCGCGLDMVPIPGDVFEEEISSLILDVAALSITANKPLGVRLLPIPHKHANEFTCFEYDFMANTRIKDVKNRACKIEIFDNTAYRYATREH